MSDNIHIDWTKPWYESKTIWLNLASVFATFLGAATQVLPSLQGLISIKTYLVVSAVVAVANIVLRKHFTSTSIGNA